MQRHNIQIGETVISIEYEDGSIKVDVPAMTYHWNNIDNIYPGENVWIDDIKQGAELEINCSSELDFEVEIGDERFSDSIIDLFAIAEKERSKASYNYPVTVSVQNHRYTLGQIIFSEMFIRMPVFTSDEQFIYWDGGISFIGNRNKRIRLDLYNEENQAYSLDLKFDDNKIELPEDFVDGEYTYSIVLESEKEELILAQETQFFGKAENIRLTDEQIESDLYKTIFSEGIRVPNIDNKIAIARKLINVMQKYGGRYCVDSSLQDIKVYFREIFMSKETYHRQKTKKIVEDYLAHVDEFKEKNLPGLPDFQRQSQYIFLREKISRGYFREKNLSEAYAAKVLLTEKINTLLLKCYWLADSKTALNLIHDYNHELLMCYEDFLK